MLLPFTHSVAKEEAASEGDERTGVQILRRALEAPTRQIADNSSVDGGVVVARMLDAKGSFGFDAGLETAVSVASVLLLTEATMTELPEPRKDRMAEAEMPV